MVTIEIEVPENENERHAMLLSNALRLLSERKMALLAKDLLERVPQKLRPNIPGRKVLVNTDCYSGLQEWYIDVFECPKCSHKNPANGTNFCGGCGIPFKLVPFYEGMI